MRLNQSKLHARRITWTLLGCQAQNVDLDVFASGFRIAGANDPSAWTRIASIHCGFLLVCLLLISSALAQSSGSDFEVTLLSIDSGGDTPRGGQFTLTGTIGQPDASLQLATGGDFNSMVAFWVGDVAHRSAS